MRLRRRERKQRTRRVRKLRLVALVGVLGLVCSLSFVYGLVTAIAGELPALDPSNRTQLAQDGFIYASDGTTVLARLRGEESRVVVGSDQISDDLKRAIVAVEDRRFWLHAGVDLRGIARALWADIRHKEIVEGGSTITQQFVKNTYTRDDRTISRKVKEAALAWQLEQRWSKDRILTAYLNTVYFGNGAYGIQMAARVYFGKKARDLTLAESALLAGIPANPTAFDPAGNPEGAKARRTTVLRLMRDQRLITAAEFREANQAPLPEVEDIRLPETKGPARHFVEYVKQQLVDRYGSGEVFGGGLRVTTTIDLELQARARAAVEEWLGERDGPSAALVAVDPRDGRVLAMYGGSRFSESQFNLAVQGERQSGSAFKPFVLAAALEGGISPYTTFESRPTSIDLGDRVWSVGNYEGSYLGPIDLVKATAASDNAVYAQLTALVGPTKVRETAQALGVTSNLNDYFAIGLGVEAVNPLEMARAFGSIANGGVRIDGAVLGNRPRAVLRVVNGRRTDDNTPVGTPVLEPGNAATATWMLRQVVEDGTGERAAIEGRQVAGKTGTTENYGDAWFVGYTPQLAVAVWVGYPRTLRPMESEFEDGPVAGGTYPALIWKTFAEDALDYLDEPPESFPEPSIRPANPLRVTYRDQEWRLDNGYCENVRQVLYVSGFEPREQADCKPNEVDVPRVIGVSVKEARERLAGLPLKAELLTRPAKPGERLGIVVDQHPRSGTLSSWDTVRIIVADAEHGTVPRVVGMDIKRAQFVLTRLGLSPVVELAAEGEAGIVLTQDPVGGVASGKGMRVKLRVGRG